MSLRTPTQRTVEKKIHTPPSIDRDPGKPKLLKSLSGRVFRRSSNSDNDTLASTGLFVPAPSLSNRYPLPKPLHIQPLSPPPTVKKINQWTPSSRSNFPRTGSARQPSNILESPIQLAPSLQVQSLEEPLGSFNLTTAFNSGYRSEPRTEVSPHDNTIIWTDTVDDPYLEEDSPTYLRSISENISNVNAKGGHRRFMGIQCAMCDEKICNVLSGEKIMELTCSHASHYQCYLATLECLQPSKRYPQCRICGKIVKPCDKNILEKMVTHILSRQGSLDCSETIVEPQLLYPGQPETASRRLFFTPGEQTIRTADVTSSGFRTPYASLGSASDGGHEVDDSLLQRSIWLEETLLDIISDDEPCGLLEDDGGHRCSSKSQIEVIACRNNSRYELTVKVPKEVGREATEQEENEETANESYGFKRQIEESIREEVDNEENLGSLVMFDKIDFSTDGEGWNRRVMLYLFDKFLVLFDRREMTIRGKIPLEQMCQVLKMDEFTLLIDLKSRTLPQVYISFQSKTLIKKWRFFLKHIGRSPSLEEMTSTSWDVLPQELVENLKSFFTQKSQAFANMELTVAKPWEIVQGHVPLQLIVCLSLSNDSGMGNDMYQDSIMNVLRSLLSLLDDDDLLGLVAVGKDGRGNVGQFGTFLGTVNKHWPHWNEAFSGLEALRYGIFNSADNELDKMLETCLRLVSTAESMLEEGKSGQFLKQVILLRDGTPAKPDHKYGRLITDVHHFDVKQISSIHRLGPEELNHEISNLHRSYHQNLTVKIASRSIQFGNMAPGEEKQLLFNVDREAIPESCEISWFDFRTQEQSIVTERVRILR